MDDKDLKNRFRYHAVSNPEVLNAIRDIGYKYSKYINETCPDGREKSLAITKLEECMFWANASIAREAR